STISRHPLVEEFFVTLVKLGLGVPHMDLASSMDVGEGCISTIFSRWINVMSVEFKCLISWPDKETLLHNLPKSFRKHYSNTQLSASEVDKTRQLAHVRIHVETVIGQLGKKYNILQQVLSISPFMQPTDTNRANSLFD
uniref:DDE Tnp4 domain-containing protein n=1 Tax=Amphimedon queenslandica TaxID=400682 RepID=A0A1X7U460_AMPQE